MYEAPRRAAGVSRLVRRPVGDDVLHQPAHAGRSPNRKGAARLTRKPPPAVRMAHISDIHVTAPACIWRREDWFNKRLSAWINLRFLGRGYRFRRADHVLSVLADELRHGGFDRILFSGDASAMGFEEEVARAAHLLKIGRTDEMPGLAVPGNHDYCTAAAARAGHFEPIFSPWQAGARRRRRLPVRPARRPRLADRAELLDGQPLAVGRARRRRPRSAAPAGGAAATAGRRAAILVTHYPVWLASGRREPRIRPCVTSTPWWRRPTAAASACGCTAIGTTPTTTRRRISPRSPSSAPAAHAERPLVVQGLHAGGLPAPRPEPRLSQEGRLLPRRGVVRAGPDRRGVRGEGSVVNRLAATRQRSARPQRFAGASRLTGVCR